MFRMIGGEAKMGSAKRIIGLCGAALFLSAQLAHGQTYVSLGYGSVPCKSWTSRSAIEARIFESWILGFISSYNAYVFKGSNVVDGTDVNGVVSWIDDQC